MFLVPVENVIQKIGETIQYKEVFEDLVGKF